MLAFDHGAGAFAWDLRRIEAKGYTDNIVDLMGGRLNRLPTTTQAALQRFACLGNVADFATLALIADQAEGTVHAQLAEAVRSGLVMRIENAYRFAHDRVQEAAYAHIPEAERAAAHLGIGRRLVEKLTPQQIAENAFEVVNQFNAGRALISDSDEAERAAELNLMAGQKAKAATAYASADRYLSIGMNLVGDRGWDRRYALTFALWLEAADCAYLSGNFENTDRLATELRSRARSNVDKAAAHRIQIFVHVAEARYREAISDGLECLQLLGIDISLRATRADAFAEYERIWINLNGRSIDSLVDLPLMTDPEKQAALRIITFLFAPASFTDNNLFYLLICRGANLTLLNGIIEASVHIFSGLAQIMGPVFHRYEDGFRFATLAHNIAERHSFIGAKAHFAMECACVWSRPMQMAIDAIRHTFRVAIETSDQSYACYAAFRLVSDLLLQGAHLDDVWSESQRGLAFVRRVKFRDPADIMISQQLLIQNLRGETDAFSSFDAAPFNENEFEAQLTDDRMPALVSWHWILKLQARFIFGDFAAAYAASEKAAAQLLATEPFIQWANYCYYRALNDAALCQVDRPQAPAEVLEALHGHLKQLREWAEASPQTFCNRHALVAAEIARLEGRELDAQHLYEVAIQTAREHGFVQSQAIANEVAARFYAARGLETIAHAYLRNARYCYLRWGAVGKVRQLEQDHPELREDLASGLPTKTIGTSIEQLDVATVVRASQAVSGEIVLDHLIETLMTIALEHAGAERGVLMLLRNNRLEIEAEAATGAGKVDVERRQAVAAHGELPETLLHTVLRTRQSVILDDAQRSNPFTTDDYVIQRRPRSVMCLPLVKQAELIGALYLENNLAPGTFTPRRIAVLELLASQAAISLDNARLYAEVITENRERIRAEASLAEAQRISRTGSWRWNVRAGVTDWSVQHYRIFGLDPRTDAPSYDVYMKKIHPEDYFLVEQVLVQAVQERRAFSHEYRLLMPDGEVKHVQTIGHPGVDEAGELEFSGTIVDITERRHAEEALRRTESELARVSRLSTMGELVGSIIHEINQPLAAVVGNAEVCLRWLNRDEPDLGEAREAITRLARDGRRTADVVKGLHALARKSGLRLAHVDVNDSIREVLMLLRDELERGAVVLHVDLFETVRPVVGDRVQLQQVLLNLIRNGVEAMSAIVDRPRVMKISSAIDDAKQALVAVANSGIGLNSSTTDRIFQPLFTTKDNGMGMGLSISRSIIDAHGGRLWASSNAPHGTIFRFTVPLAPGEA